MYQASFIGIENQPLHLRNSVAVERGMHDYSRLRNGGACV